MPTVTRTNLCTNPSFEAGITGWTAGGNPAPVVAQSAAQAQNRTKSLLVTWAAGNIFLPDAGFVLATTSGTQYTLSAYVYVPAGNPMVTLLVGGVGLGGFSAASTLTDQWQRLSVTVTASSSSHRVSITPSGTPTAGQICYIDSILAEQAPVAASYFDGASSGCQWTGTADLSTSQQLSGPLAITVVNDLANQPPRNTIFVSGAPGTTVQVTRTDPDGNVRSVRGADPGTLVSTQWIGYDYEAPFGQAVTYTAVPSDGSANAFIAATPLAVAQSWLIHPGIPALSMPINGTMRTDRTYDTGSAEHAILGSPFPRVQTNGARKSGKYQLSIQTKTAAEADSLTTLLAGCVPLLLQLAFPFTAATSWQYISVGPVTEHEVTKRFGDPQRVWTMDITIVDRPAGNAAALRTFADVPSDPGVGTFQDLRSVYKTFQGVLTGVPGT